MCAPLTARASFSDSAHGARSRCVEMDDVALATHAKARKAFLDGWSGVNAVVLGGSADAAAEAAAYEAQLRYRRRGPRTLW